MQPVGVDEGADLAAKWIRRVVRLLRHVGDGSRRVDGSDWTVAEVAAHLRVGVREYPRLLQGEKHPWASLDDGAAMNAGFISTVPERDLPVLAGLVERDGLALVELMRAHGEQPVIFAAGLEIPGPSLAGFTAGECMIHGLDVARTFGLPWPIPAADALVLLRAATPLLPMLVDPAAPPLEATFGVKLRGGPEFAMTFAGGGLTVTDGRPDRADCRIVADPTAYLLSAYGRLGQWAPVVRGQMVAYGRKPWLAMQIAKVMRTP